MLCFVIKVIFCDQLQSLYLRTVVKLTIPRYPLIDVELCCGNMMYGLELCFEPEVADSVALGAAGLNNSPCLCEVQLLLS